MNEFTPEVEALLTRPFDVNDHDFTPDGNVYLRKSAIRRRLLAADRRMKLSPPTLLHFDEKKVVMAATMTVCGVEMGAVGTAIIQQTKNVNGQKVKVEGYELARNETRAFKTAAADLWPRCAEQFGVGNYLKTPAAKKVKDEAALKEFLGRAMQAWRERYEQRTNGQRRIPADTPPTDTLKTNASRVLDQFDLQVVSDQTSGLFNDPEEQRQWLDAALKDGTIKPTMKNSEVIATIREARKVKRWNDDMEAVEKFYAAAQRFFGFDSGEALKILNRVYNVTLAALPEFTGEKADAWAALVAAYINYGDVDKALPTLKAQNIPGLDDAILLAVRDICARVGREKRPPANGNQTNEQVFTVTGVKSYKQGKSVHYLLHTAEGVDIFAPSRQTFEDAGFFDAGWIEKVHTTMGEHPCASFTVRAKRKIRQADGTEYWTYDKVEDIPF